MGDKGKYDRMDDVQTFVPHNVRRCLRNWINNGIIGGDFIMSVLKNDLLNSMVLADNMTRRHIPTIVNWIYKFAPGGCWGNEFRVEEWPDINRRNKKLEKIRIEEEPEA